MPLLFVKQRFVDLGKRWTTEFFRNFSQRDSGQVLISEWYTVARNWFDDGLDFGALIEPVMRNRAHSCVVAVLPDVSIKTYAAKVAGKAQFIEMKKYETFLISLIKVYAKVT